MSNSTRRRFGSIMALRSLIAVSVIVLVLALFSRPASAWSGPLDVSGIVCEGSTSNPIGGAYVLVEILDAGNNVLVSDHYHTIGDGLYGVFFFDVDEASTKVKVTATLAGGAWKEEIRDITSGNMKIDIVFPYGIPQIAGAVGMGIAVVAVGTVAFVSLRRKRPTQL